MYKQDCAATNTLRYARCAFLQDVSYARVGPPQVRPLMKLSSCMWHRHAGVGMAPSTQSAVHVCQGTLQAHEVHREKTALEFAEHTLWALEKGSDRFRGIPDPPAYARPALDDAPAQPPKRQEPAPAAPKPPVAPLKPEVRRALTRVARLKSTRSLAPRVTAGWTPKVQRNALLLCLPHSICVGNCLGHVTRSPGVPSWADRLMHDQEPALLPSSLAHFYGLPGPCINIAGGCGAVAGQPR